MELFDNIMLGLSTALAWNNLLWCIIGVSLGTLIGVIPGVGTLATMSLLFPITYVLEPTAALIMLAGIWYGSTYGGSTASILLNLPGTPANAVTCLDGFPMAKQGRGGVALLMTTVASFFGASVGIVMMMLFSPLVAEVAFKFGPAEYFSIMALGLVAASVVSSGSAIKGITMVVGGVMLGLVGTDVNSGVARFDFGFPELQDGVQIVALAMGLFGVTEIIASINHVKAADRKIDVSMKAMLPTRDEMKRSWGPMARGSGLGSFFGVLPGVGPTVAAFMAYALEKRTSKTPERFGRGAIEGIMAPESANNASDQASFIPTMTLGIPRQRDDGLDHRRAHDPRHPARPANADRAARDVLGPGDEFLDRQHRPGDPERADDRSVGPCVDDSLSRPLPGDRDVHLHRHLCGQQQRLRRLRGSGVRHRRLHTAGARLRARAAAARLCTGPDAGGELPARHAAFTGSLQTFIERPISMWVLLLTVFLLAWGMWSSLRQRPAARMAPASGST